MFKIIGLAAAMLALVAVGSVHAESGAVAYGNGKSAKVLGQPTQTAARAKAMAECGQDCRSLGFDKGQCGAIAIGGTGFRFLGKGASQSDADNQAMSECSSKMGMRGNCRIGVSACQ